MVIIYESSLTDLYRSTERAFPETGLRQHATHTIKIANLRWTPFMGMKTLFIRGLAQNEGKEYNPLMLIKGIDYDASGVQLIASNGAVYEFAKPSLEKNDVLLRCNCADFRYRFLYYNSLDKSLYGRRPTKYIRVEGSNRPPANPLELPGMCKHTIKLAEIISKSGIFS